uniref:Uncharacterized protein n=1 Tax=Aegilops tauschii subsp. strangulata TaxID=200361 RepID=A0A453KND4_AEGTS
CSSNLQNLSVSFSPIAVCLLVFSYELHRQLNISSGISVMAADPGVVETRIMRELPPCLSRFAFFILRTLNLLQQPDTGIGAVLDAALAPPVTFLSKPSQSFCYFDTRKTMYRHSVPALSFSSVSQEASGKYFFGGKGRTIRSSVLSYDIEVAKKLWAASSALLRDLRLRDRESRTGRTSL